MYNKYCVSQAPSQTRQTAPAEPTPGEVEAVRVDNMNDANDRGIDAYHKGQFGLAIKYFERALEFSPYSYDLKKNLAKAKEGKARADEAATHEAAARAASKALQEAAAAKASGESAESSATDRAHANIGKVFDTPGQRAPADAVDATGLNSHSQKLIASPAVAKDPRYRKLQSQGDTLDTKLQELDSQLTAVRKQKAQGADATSIGNLNVQEAKIKQQIVNTFSEKAVVQIQTNDFMVKFEEESKAQETGAKKNK
jgi:tetratricopeptide (TPR) repeat protein